MKKIVLAIFVMMQVASIRAEDAMEDVVDVVDVVDMNDATDAQQPMDTPSEEMMVVTQEMPEEGCKSDNILCKLWNAIKSFLMGLVERIKNLFGMSQSAEVEMVVETETPAMTEEVAQDGSMDQSTMDASEEDENQKLSSLERKHLTQEPEWLQERA